MDAANFYPTCATPELLASIVVPSPQNYSEIQCVIQGPKVITEDTTITLQACPVEESGLKWDEIAD